MRIEVVNSQVYDSNPYQRLLYKAINARYQITHGSIDKAIARLEQTGRSIYHIHWEDSRFAKCRTVQHAIAIRQTYIEKLKRYVELGGKVVWTLHNIKPHEWRFEQTFLGLRKDLAALSHRILVHNQSALCVLQEQTGLTDLEKVRVLPHPAYCDIYEPVEQTIARAGKRPIYSRSLLYFGLVRAYKGIPGLIRKMPSEFMAQHQLALHVCGEPVRADAFLDDLLAETRDRPEITYRLESIPVEQVADLLRSHAGLVIPYHKVLTSGVTVLSLTLGVPTVAPNTSAMKELYPQSAHHLLFNHRSAKDFRRAVLALMDMSTDERARIVQDYLKHAQSYHPMIISKMLGDIYNDVLGLTDSDWAAAEAAEAKVLAILDQASELSPDQQWRRHGDASAYFQVPLLLRMNAENSTMLTPESQNAPTTLSNQQIALELVKSTLLGSVRSGIPDALILQSVQDANKLAAERARLDSFYAVRLYTSVLDRLEKSQEPKSSTPPPRG